jgi:hypothetical protein
MDFLNKAKAKLKEVLDDDKDKDHGSHQQHPPGPQQHGSCAYQFF